MCCSFRQKIWPQFGCRLAAHKKKTIRDNWILPFYYNQTNSRLHQTGEKSLQLCSDILSLHVQDPSLVPVTKKVGYFNSVMT
ncbi:hypothetical protein GUJ93_ZPchr0002g25297 [Zizania palustris]|uniref:Uncharacterized protein n=1 Tax=Zizania palustris TaxID=103762 RepID=A0A8J5S7R9_ZIZPA|nr:hypothetical protein GUJ93_ZPchr0002g25297 [Zizania palustris]